MDCSNTAHMLLGAAYRRRHGDVEIAGALDQPENPRNRSRTRVLARRRQRRAERRDVVAQAMLDFVVDQWHLPPECEPASWHEVS